MQATGIVKSYGRGDGRTTVLNGIDLEITEGDFVAIMGPSGSGKSTLLYALSGLDDVDAGTIRWGNDDLTAMAPRDRARLRLHHMGFVFQHVHLLRNLSILDNVVLPGVTATPKQRDAVVARARELLERLGIAELADRHTTAVSGGQLQRAALARALINSPDVLFGDEPTGALNATAASELMGLLAEVHADGTTVVLVTHDPVVASGARRVVVLRDGLVEQELTRGDETDDAWAERLTQWLMGRT